MRRDLDLTLLRAFAAVVEAGSVTAAARQLNRTQAAVSLQVKRLEETLAQSLFDREHKRLVLAPAGEQLLGFAQRLIAMNDEVFERMTTPDLAREVRLGVPVDIISTYVPPILRRFHAVLPNVRVALVAKSTQELLEDLEGGAVDLTLTTEIEQPRRAEALMTDALVWIGAPGGAVHRRRPLPVVLGSKWCRFKPVTIDTLRRAGIEWRSVLDVANQDALNATIQAGLAVGVLLRETVRAPLEILSDDCGLPQLPRFKINLYLPKVAHNDTAIELAHHIRAEFAARVGAAGPRPAPRPLAVRPKVAVLPAARAVSRVTAATVRRARR